MSQDPGDVTLAAYQCAVPQYVEASDHRDPAVEAHLDRLAARRPGGSVLEVGSGPGRDAAHLEARGLHVRRTDGAPAFVERLRRAGHEAHVLDVRHDALGGPYDVVMAHAVLLHLSHTQVADFLSRAAASVVERGLLSITLKEGAGSAWSEAKIGPRHFTFWQEDELREVLHRTGWSVLHCEHVVDRPEPWLLVLAQADAVARSPTSPPLLGRPAPRTRGPGA